MSIVLMGSTSGSCTLQEQAVAGSTTLTLPTITGTVGVLVSGTAVASTSGTSIDFTSIPAGVRRITVILGGVSSSGASPFLVQLGTSSGIVATGYVSGSGDRAGEAAYTTGFALNRGASAASTFNAVVPICLYNTNAWATSGVISRSDGFANGFGGISPTLASALDRVRITTVNGTDTFDAGSINILYE